MTTFFIDLLLEFPLIKAKLDHKNLIIADDGDKVNFDQLTSELI